MTEPQLNFKVVLVGESGVGKTNLLSRYINNKFFVGQNTTIGIEFSSKVISIKGTQVKVQIWDTAGQERYRALASAFYKNAVGALLVFDLTIKQTFQRLGKWIEEIRQQAATGLAMMLVGNKNDLAENRQVTTEEALQFAQQHNMAYVETSACSGCNVNSSFDRLFQQIYDQFVTEQIKPEPQQQARPVALTKKSMAECKGQEPTRKKKSCC